MGEPERSLKGELEAKPPLRLLRVCRSETGVMVSLLLKHTKMTAVSEVHDW